jgi:shikimate kinase
VATFDASNRAPHWVLVGLMGSGKSTIGELIAERTGRPYVDSDGRVETASGLTAEGVAAAHGMVALHRLELQVLEDALRAPTPTIIGSAASVVDTSHGRALLSECAAVVWLQVPVDELVRRVREGGDHRPLGDDVADTLRAQAHRRGPLYEDVATVTVDASGDPATVAAEIVDALAATTGNDG